MEALYWVLTWACHRRCDHCYDARFRPYVRDGLTAVVGEGKAAYHKIIANLPEDMTYEVTGKKAPDGTPIRRRTLLVMAGGELLIDGVREELFYPALDALRERYGARLPNISVQTTGDIMTDRHLDEMLERGVRTIAIASIDDWHVGMKGDKKFDFMAKIRTLMEKAGAREIGIGGARDPRLAVSTLRPADDDPGPFFLFFGAQPELWIGELWPRGRAWENGLSKATYETNFCARWSGGRNFLEYGKQGSEVAIEPDGSIYPCCLKTKAPLGNLTEERLTDILDSLKGHPAFEAINAGDPEAMGLEMGWSREDYRQASHTTDPKGRAFANVCIGCDVFFKEKLSAEITRIRASRLAAHATAWTQASLRSNPMQRRKLGKNGPEVSALGLGCMSMSAVYGQKPDDAESLATLDHALTLGINFWDTADVYGFHHNEKLIAKALQGRRDKIVIATKFGFVRDPASPSGVGVNGKADYVRTACEGSLNRLGTDHIDLYYLHRVDPKTPIEETVGAMADLVKAGKIRFIGLSEVSPATLERACKVHPIAAVQSEYSLWTRDPEAGIIPACNRLGVGFVPYSPLGRGFLTGEIKSPDDFDANDWRRSNPRFQGEQFAANLRLVDHIKALATSKGVTASQLALGWVMAQGESIVPIPGTRRRKYLDDNAGAARETLSKDELAAIDKAFPRNLDAGPRYTQGGMAAVNG